MGPGARSNARLLIIDDSPSEVLFLETILEVAPEVPVLVVHQGARAPSLPALPSVSTLMLGRTMRNVLRPEMDRALLRVRIEQMRHLLAGKDRVGILLQDDPDPDAISVRRSQPCRRAWPRPAGPRASARRRRCGTR